jgi:glycosyltransferase involved in cell wall biosynthesis
MRHCIVIPHFRHERQLPTVLEQVEGFGYPVIIVDDGSPPDSFMQVRSVVSKFHAVRVERLTSNRGKGAAVVHGLGVANALGFTHAIQVDADGQHDISRIPALVEASASRPQALVSGHPVFDDSVPRSRLKGRQISIFWVRLHTWSRDILDPMCGLRVYPVNLTLGLVGSRRSWMRMEFDLEILVRAHWADVPLMFLPVRVNYPADGHSNFNIINDNIRISLMHTRLFFGMIWRSPLLIWRALRPAAAP